MATPWTSRHRRFMTLFAVLVALPACTSNGAGTTTTSASLTTPSPAPATDPVDPSVVPTENTEAPASFSMSQYSYFEVPVLGAEDVRGSGCGSGVGPDSSLPDVLPDGLWFGSLGPKYEYYEVDGDAKAGFGYSRFDGSTLQIDIWCVYAGATAESKYLSAQCQAKIECEANNTTAWLVEDPDDRMWTVPVERFFEYREDPYVAELGWICGSNDSWRADSAWRMQPVWIAVNGGEVTEIFGHCAYYLEASGNLQ